MLSRSAYNEPSPFCFPLATPFTKSLSEPHILLKGTALHFNARKEVGLKYNDTGDYLEIDIYIPSLRLAIEFNEKHHYSTLEQSHVPLQQIKNKDKSKREIIEVAGLTLITIPYWWDGTLPRYVTVLSSDLLIHCEKPGSHHQARTK